MVAELHAALQITFGWTDTHLHRFVIHGREYGIVYLGGLGFRNSPDGFGLAFTPSVNIPSPL
jgi:Plasmid pRiA4b ORF-3-like protein